MNPMGSIENNLTKNSFNNIQASLMNQERQYLNINWEEFNYPPLLKLIHYNSNELNDPHKSLVKKMNLSFILVFVATLLGFIGNIIQVVMSQVPAVPGVPDIRIFYAVMNLVIFNPAALYVFYKGYKELVIGRSNLRLYKILQAILGLAWLMCSIIAAGAFDGWVRVSQLFGSRADFSGILAFIESIVYALNSLLAIYCVYATHRFDDKATMTSNGHSNF